jgi:hypothetical protein
MPLDMQWSMQDGTAPHTANKVLDLLHNNFGARVISHYCLDRQNYCHFWPPLSPALNPCDFFCGVSWRRRLSHRDLQTSWTGEQQLSTPAVCRDILNTFCNEIILSKDFRNKIHSLLSNSPMNKVLVKYFNVSTIRAQPRTWKQNCSCIKKTERKRPLRIYRHRWNDYINMDFK